MIDAPPGRIFISPDLPQADARIVAWDAQCISMIKALSDPTRHLHIENCNRLFGHKLIPGTPETEEYQNGDEYRQGKAMLHAANYRMSAKRLAIELGLDLRSAKQLLERYFHLYPEIPLWHNTIKSRLTEKGFLETPPPFNRRRLFYTAYAELLNTGKISNESWNSACSWIPQSAVADIINWGLRRLKNEFGDAVWVLKHDHDSYLVAIPPARLGSIAATAINMLKIPLVLHDRQLVMVPEMKYGLNYGMLIDWKGEEVPDYGALEVKKTQALDTNKLCSELYGYI